MLHKKYRKAPELPVGIVPATQHPKQQIRMFLTVKNSLENVKKIQKKDTICPELLQQGCHKCGTILKAPVFVFTFLFAIVHKCPLLSRCG